MSGCVVQFFDPEQTSRTRFCIYHFVSTTALIMCHTNVDTKPMRNSQKISPQPESFIGQTCSLRTAEVMMTSHPQPLKRHPATKLIPPNKESKRTSKALIIEVSAVFIVYTRVFKFVV